MVQSLPGDPLKDTPADCAQLRHRPRRRRFPGNNLGKLEFTPKPEYQSAGSRRPRSSRKQSDLIVVRVTDETVPDKGKKRYALSLSIHGIERAGVEGGTRAMEDLVTAATTGGADEPIVPAERRRRARRPSTTC